MTWILGHLDDLDADFRVFYGIDDLLGGSWAGLSGERLVALAERTPAYAGVMQARVSKLMERDGGDQGDAGDDVASTLTMTEAG